jgi:hypothetical protein
VDDRATAGRRFDINDHGQFFIIDFNQVDRVTSNVLVGRHDGRDWMTDKQGLAGRQHAIIRHLQVRQRRGAGHRADFFSDVFARVNGHHSRSVCRCGRVDRINASVRIHRPHKSDVQRIRQANVIDVVRQAFD